jgi:chromosome segregation ATPase
LKKTILDREQEGLKVYDDIQSTKRDVEDRDSEVYSLNRDIEQVRKSNEQLRRENEILAHDISQNHDVRKRQQQHIYQLKNDLRF